MYSRIYTSKNKQIDKSIDFIFSFFFLFCFFLVKYIRLSKLLCIAYCYYQISHNLGGSNATGTTKQRLFFKRQ